MDTFITYTLFLHFIWCLHSFTLILFGPRILITAAISETKQKRDFKSRQKTIEGPQEKGMLAANFRSLLLRSSVTEIHDEGHFVFSCSNVGPAKAVSNEAD
jgi:hypothetical protein